MGFQGGAFEVIFSDLAFLDPNIAVNVDVSALTGFDITTTVGRRCASSGPESTCYDAEKLSIHCAAHDVTQDRTTRTDKRACDNQ